MGNSPPNGGLRLGNGDYTYSANVRGSSATLNFIGRAVQQLQIGEIAETWMMFYIIAGMFNCTFNLRKSLLLHNPMFNTRSNEKLSIIINDHLVQGFIETFVVSVEKGEEGTLLHNYMRRINFCIMTNVTTITTNANRDIIELSFDMYGAGPVRGLLIREWKRKSIDKNPYTGTVAHYYVNVANGEDVGLSVMVKKIKVMENGQFDFAVDGPEQHPVAALCYMFNEVFRTKTWKPTLCPHCASRSYKQDIQSESESDIANFPSAPSHNSNRRKGGGLISNDGTFKGNHNGNTYIKNFIM